MRVQKMSVVISSISPSPIVRVVAGDFEGLKVSLHNPKNYQKRTLYDTIRNWRFMYYVGILDISNIESRS